MAIPLIAFSPDSSWIATAAASSISVFDSADAGKAAKDIKLEHNVLVMCVSADSRWLFVASEDKTAAVYSTSTWSEVKRCSAPKKVSAACFTSDCRHVIVGDKFGDVFSLDVNPESAQKELVPLLGHYCAIITSILAAPFGFVASGDRDGKLRISELPEKPEKGSWSIISYCLGHTAAVTCSALCTVDVGGKESKQLLVSGGLEGMVVVWNWRTGKQRCSMQLRSDTEINGQNDVEGEGGLVTMATCGPIIAAAQAKRKAIVLLQCVLNGDDAQLNRIGDVVIDAVALPSRLWFETPDILLAVGVSEDDKKGHITVGRAQNGWACKADDDISKKICKHCASLEDAEYVQYHSELHKKDYSWQEREDRKKKRLRNPYPQDDSEAKRVDNAPDEKQECIA